MLKLSSSKRNPFEDYLTEIFAHVLRKRKDIFLKMLKKFEISNLNELGRYNVKTQKTFSKINDQHSDSRLDIFIELIDQKEIIIFESKIGSGEGYEQLKKYAKQLESFVDSENKVLIYITRDYDPKNKDNIFSECKNKDNLKFKPIRWYEMYNFLNKYKKNDPLIEEVLKFMEENNLAVNNQFTNVDVLSMCNFSSARNKMDETMGGEVKEKFKEFTKNISRSYTRFTQMRKKHRFIISSNTNKMWWGYGYWLETLNITGYPKVGVILELTPRSNQHGEFLKIGRKIIESDKDKWQERALVKGEKWPGILQLRSLQEFMSKLDHVKAIKEFFMGALDDIIEIRKKYPELPWPK